MKTLAHTALPIAILLLATGCGTPIEDGFSRATWDEIKEDKEADREDEGGVDPGDEAPVNDTCWGVSGTLDMPEGAAPPRDSGDAIIFLFDAEQVSDRGFPGPDAEIIDEAGASASALPVDFQLCYQEGMEGREIIVIAFLDVDGDEELCDDGDFVGDARTVVDPVDSDHVDISFESVIYGPDCGRDDDAVSEE